MMFLIPSQSTGATYPSHTFLFIYSIRLTLVACILFVISFSITSAQTVHIPDPGLRAALELALGKQTDEDITQEEMASLGSLDALETGIRNIRGLDFAVNLTELHLGRNWILDLSPLEDLKNLSVLDLHLNGELLVLNPLKSLINLTWLSLSENRITDVTPLKDLTNLRYLALDENEISNVSPLKNLTNLTELHLNDNKNLSILGPLQNMVNLTFLELHGNIISDISALNGLLNLRDLRLQENRIPDVSALEHLTKLTYLNLDDNYRISDLTPLESLTNLRHLSLDENQIRNLSPLRNLTNLRYLALDDNRITDITPLKNLTNLRELDLNDNKNISDVTPLQNMVNLTFLELHGNNISDVSSLNGLVNLRDLRLQENQISNVFALRNMVLLSYLDLYDNAILDMSPLKNLTNLKYLDLRDNNISDFSPLEGLLGNLVVYYTDKHSKSPDVNRDGTVDITDLILIASNFTYPDLEELAESNIYPDVNNDGVVNLIDLLLVAAEIGSNAAAPALSKNAVLVSNLTSENLVEWIQSAKNLDIEIPNIHKGISILQQLLAIRSSVETSHIRTAVLRNYPNPFNPETWIPYQLAKPAEVVISIYSVDGKRIRTLKLGYIPAGIYHDKHHAAYWDGRNEFGESIASGVYFYTFMADDFTSTGRMFIRK